MQLMQFCEELKAWRCDSLQQAINRENPEHHKKVQEIVPIFQLEANAKQKFKELFKQDPTTSTKILRDLAVYELVTWFKKDFFTWVDRLKCDRCQCDMNGMGNVPPTPEDLQHGASRVEKYVCPQCNDVQRFPRYNSAGKLLETRRGRCGEWSNCFAMILRAFGYLTRHVNDFNDHVWCEYFSETEQRWIHVDPCEGLVDKPKVYDQGWGKKYTRVLATSIFDVQDVTKRYVVDRDALKQRRQRFRLAFEWLNSDLCKDVEILQDICTPELKAKLNDMRLKELVELMFSKSQKLSGEELQGRQSGSLAWRLSRQETSQGYTIRPNEAEINDMKIDISYDINKDSYIRKTSSGQDVISHWSSMTLSNANVFKKEEFDWKMVYLARQESGKEGFLSWELDLSQEKISVKSVELYVTSKCYENGSVFWRITSNANKVLLPTPGK